MKNPIYIITILLFVLFSGCQDGNPLLPKYGVNRTTSEIGYLDEFTKCSWDSLKLRYSVNATNDSLITELFTSKVKQIESESFESDIYYFKESNLLVGIGSNHKLRYVTYVKKGYPIFDGHSKHFKTKHRNQIINLINNTLEGFECED